jgi:hypothetical protein
MMGPLSPTGLPTTKLPTSLLASRPTILPTSL